MPEKEKSKDFINASRQILNNNISQQNKEDEMQRLSEYMSQEHEKLIEAKRSLLDDSEKFKITLEEMQKQLQETI